MIRMARIALAALTVMIFWGPVAVAAVAVTAQVNVRWNAQVGYLLVAAAVVAAWEASDIVLRRLRLNPPYRPD